MKEEIAVSVFCLAYNHEKYIRHTLEGFVNQKTNFKYEVFIHDDASTDGTAAVIREYEEKYPELIKPIYQTENQYSQGIKIGDTHLYPRASGKYICWCEGDDYWCSEDKLQKQYDAMEAHPECSMCVHKVKCVNEDGSPNEDTIPDERFQLQTGVLEEETVCNLMWDPQGCYPFQTSSYFVRKDVLDERQHVELNGLNGDMRTLRVSLCKGAFYYIDECLSAWRLFSIGGWNSRLRDASDQVQIDISKKRINAEIKFNDYSEGKYWKYIHRSITIRALGWCTSDPVGARKLIVENGLSQETVDVIPTYKLKIYYFLLLHWIGAFKIIKLLKSFKDKAKEWKTKMKR